MARFYTKRKKDKYKRNLNINYDTNKTSVDYDRPTITSTITNAVIDYYTHKRWAVAKEIAVKKKGELRVDVFAFNLGGDFVGIEVKSSKADFYADKKIKKYLKYFNKFYIACPLDVKDYIEQRLPDNRIGIFCLGVDGYLWCMKKATSLEGLKRSRKNKLLLRLAYRSAEFSARNRKRRTRRFYE